MGVRDMAGTSSRAILSCETAVLEFISAVKSVPAGAVIGLAKDETR